ncbi:assimilatory nitrate reductase (NADH) beta subunit [Tropicibacter naphthalenivorans]|uniref:Nitrite reductase [NAD(P)H] n=1 Tax=Tropicibacter naphthalenivorans TaxID=441103 RepID=A0A0P1GJB7_9RHOB|nr:Nitrite reductase [NAD(P)H] [Tropicibacter naphthalenivorans]SMC43225.1 assimilatory nitrate reductase (NADH) beta subunit [Tropicibacter naphthalenivorans]
MTQRLVIIGVGMASGRMLEHLCDEGADWDVTLFNAEPRGCYNRIMLSPVLAGEKTYEQIVTHDADWYEARGVDCRFGQRVAQIDRSARVVVAENGDRVPYDKLVIATGSSPFIIPLPGHDLEGVIAYRDLEDTQRMMTLGAGKRAVVIGGGVLGLEAAAGMAARGVDVTVVHLMGHLMERQLDAEAGALLRKALVAKGIKVLVSTNSKEIVGKDGHVTALRLDNGTELPCDLLVMAVGIRPNIALAQAAGLDCGRGVTVADDMTTSDADVLALGECVEHRGALFGLVAPLYDQARVAADTLMGRAAVYAPKDVSTKLKVTGCDLFSAGDFASSDAREDILLRDPARSIYKRLVLEGDRVVGAVMYGDTADGPWIYSLIKDGTDVSAMRAALIFGPSYAEAPAPLSRCSLAG